ncbi:TetR/AcrR family transcriptional regulator [Novosphingobium lentum]|uniref:TetR/AcrR family transcriptional regulator n=1 Tax=Novosphingobium lentum TaxID=145287 RepID=UPI00082EAE81|nr:TetR/AcrR family transcriptional regulator [Novosphingobium lentum]
MYVSLARNFDTVPWTGALSLDRPPASVLKILNGALQALGERGAERLSMSTIGKLAGVSRGTLYRYFKTKEDVLRAVSEHVSLAFENGIRDVATGIADPIQRLHCVLRFHNEYSTLQEADKMLIVDPVFVVNFFHNHAPRHRAALLDALGPSLDHFDRHRASPIDRAAVADLLVRLQTSRIILRTTDRWNDRWDSFSAQMEQMLRGDPRPAN